MPNKRFWISWVQPGDDYRPLTYPPNTGILGWWCSGYSGEGSTICAVVEAPNSSDAKAAILKDWPEALELDDWRFVEERAKDWRPNDRFPLSEWMEPRFNESENARQTD